MPAGGVDPQKIILQACTVVAGLGVMVLVLMGIGIGKLLSW